MKCLSDSTTDDVPESTTDEKIPVNCVSESITDDKVSVKLMPVSTMLPIKEKKSYEKILGEYKNRHLQ